MYGRKSMSTRLIPKTTTPSTKTNIEISSSTTQPKNNKITFTDDKNLITPLFPPLSVNKPINKPILDAINEAERESLSPKVEIINRNNSSVFKPCLKLKPGFIQTPKPKRRFENKESSFSEILNVSPLCDAELVQIEPPMKTPLLMRTVAQRIQHQEKTLANSPLVLRNSSPKDDSDKTLISTKCTTTLLSPIEKTTAIESFKRVYNKVFQIDDLFDRICDAEVERLLENVHKRQKFSIYDDSASRFYEPVANTLTTGDKNVSFVIKTKLHLHCRRHV